MLDLINMRCAACYGSFQLKDCEGKNQAKILDCDHVFHKACIIEKKECSLCNFTGKKLNADETASTSALALLIATQRPMVRNIK